MPDWIITIGGLAVQIAGFGAALIAIYKWFALPIKTVRTDLEIVKGDTCDLLYDRLTQAHDYNMRKGYCSKGDKMRLCAMHTRYRAMGRNHLVDTYEQDLLELPDEPVRK